MVKAFESGGVDFINKPFVKDEILARIKTHLSVAKLQKELIEQVSILKERERYISELITQKNQLIRMVSHDIKNPLTGIIGVTQILIEDHDLEKEEQLSMLKMVGQSAESLFALVKDQLDKQEEDEDIIEDSWNPSEFKLDDVVLSSIGRYELSAETKDITLSYECENKALVISADKDKLETLFQIMISNGIKFTMNKGSVGIRTYHPAEDILRIEITDTGIGIPSAILKYFIIPTSPDQIPDHGAVLGANVGLDIVRKIVELHQGKIWVSTQEDKGTTFFIELPINQS